MIANTEAQRALHPALIGTDASRVIDCLQCSGALGWKVNGAGDEGGSLTILSGTTDAKATIERLVSSLSPHYRILPIAIDTTGVTTTVS